MSSQDYSDVARFAESLGHSYNAVLSMMEKDKFIPFYETSTKEIYVGFGKDYGLSEELSSIIDRYVEETGNTNITE